MGWMMRIRKGEIYLADLGNVACADIGKVRPVLVFQNNMLNRMIEDGLYDDVVIIPLSSQIVNNDFGYLLKKREKLQKDSMILCNAVKMIKSKRLLLEKGLLLTLTAKEFQEVERRLSLLLDLSYLGQ